MSIEIEPRQASRQNSLYFTPDTSPILSHKKTMHPFGKNRASTQDTVSRVRTLVETSPPKSSTHSRRLSLMSGSRRRTGSVLTEAESWRGPDRIKLVKEGYQSLAVICTFIAGVQAQIITISYNQTDLASQIVNALFFAGLFADIGAATLSAASGRWYEMMMPIEADHVYDWIATRENSASTIEEEEEEEKEKRGVVLLQRTDSAEKGSTDASSDTLMPGSDQAPPSPECLYFIERWLCVSLKAGPYIAILGLGLLVSGVMIWVWTHQSVIVQGFCTVLCASLVVLLPPFVIQHDRIRALTFVKLRRFSG